MSAGGRWDELIGRTISQYRILSRLGQGGMGVVYKAEHTKLRKTVALKFLRPESLEDENIRLRFVREARAAASLDHSSICAIHDFDESDEQTFIVMAYLAGCTLQERIRQGPLPLNEALIVAIQIAEGLQEAHQQDILHRDIKPSNVMFTTDGEAKIVDFGLALVKDATRVTRTGKTLGTALYMSPEQTTGSPVDHCTDIWSLGVVLYEMLSGKPPFLAERREAVHYAVVNENPESLMTLCAEVTPELAWIVEKCLAKDPEDRYRDCAELLHDLRTARMKVTATGKAARPSWILQNRGRMLVGGISLLAVAAAIVVAVVFWPAGAGREVFRDATPLQVTSDEAWEGEPALSPDGTRIAYTRCLAGNYDVFVVNARGGRPLQLTLHPASDRDPCWLPDGSGLLFASDREGNYGIWQVDQLGGEATLVLPEAMDPAPSPDGRWLACGRIAPEGDVRIVVLPWLDPTRARWLTGPAEHGGEHRHPAWSPDGRNICYATGHGLWLVPFEGGPTRLLTEGGIADDFPVWAPAGEHLYFSSFRDNATALWRVDADGGRPDRLTFGSSGESHPTVSADGRRLAYATSTQADDEDIVIVDRATGKTGGLAGEEHDNFLPNISEDGHLLVFVSDSQDGRFQIWLQELAGCEPRGDPRRLTDQPGNALFPALSPDDRWVAYYRVVDERRDLWVVSTQGGPPVRITDDGTVNQHPAWSPDGGRIAFASDREGGRMAIWSLALVEGIPAGDLRRHSPRGQAALFPAWSPDGGRIAWKAHFEGYNYPYVADAADPGTARRIDAVVDVHRLRWNMATGDLWVSRRAASGPLPLLAISADLESVTELDPPFFFHPNLEEGFFDISGNGQVIVYSYPKRMGQIWLLESMDGAF